MAKTAVVVIDLQNDILTRPDERHRRETAALEDMAGRVQKMVQRARATGSAVLFVQHDGPPGHRLEVGTRGWEIRPDVAPLAAEPVIHKKACDAFFETKLNDELLSRSIEHLVIAGCMTQFCIDTTVRRAVSMGYDVTLAADGHMTTDSSGLTFEQIIAHHNILLDGFDAGNRAARVVLLEQIQF